MTSTVAKPGKPSTGGTMVVLVVDGEAVVDVFVDPRVVGETDVSVQAAATRTRARTSRRVAPP
jgi:hypothetical protein